MKQHAILIETHDNANLLALVLNKMRANNHYFFIHVDIKYKNYNSFLTLASDHVIFLPKRYNVKWGSVEQIYLTLELIQMAKNYPINFDYYHLISGQDYPTRNNDAFDSFFEGTKKSFMELVDDTNLSIEHRFMLYHINSFINVRKRIGQKLEKICSNIQLKISKYHNIRPKVNLHIYKGSNWWSLNNETITYIIDYITQNPNYLKRFKYSSCCDEIFFHTIVFNSPLKKEIELTDLRYYDWIPTYPGESIPRTLTTRDFIPIMKSKTFFCRKISLPQSSDLIKLINNQ